jgi:general secretion pathway protein I
MRRQQGFTLLEVLVATVIMAIAVTGLLSSLSTSARNASKLLDYDRAAVLAKRQLDELMSNRVLPKGQPFEGRFDPATTGGVEAGWRAEVRPFETRPGGGPGQPMIERIAVEVFWKSGNNTRRFALEGFRRAVMTPQDMGLGVMMP